MQFVYLFTFFQEVERIMRKVQANLAGIFPTVDNPIWDEALKSLEIRFQADSAETDYRFLMSVEQCEYYNYVMQHYLMESSIKQKFQEQKDLIDHLEGNSGFKLEIIQDVRALYDALQIEYSNGNTYCKKSDKYFLYLIILPLLAKPSTTRIVYFIRTIRR